LCSQNIYPEIFLLSTNDALRWTDDLSVRTQEVDEQHKDLINLINRLDISIGKQHGQNTSRAIFDELMESAQEHFLFEESLMRLTHYPEYVHHKEQHEALMEHLRTIQYQLNTEGTDITEDVVHLQKHWWPHHIRSSDQHFSVHYERAGLIQPTDGSRHKASPTLQKPAWWKFW
jgi:hemerythrin